MNKRLMLCVNCGYWHESDEDSTFGLCAYSTCVEDQSETWYNTPCLNKRFEGETNK